MAKRNPETDDSLENLLGSTSELSYPPKVKGNARLEALTAEWKTQKRVKCCHKECCYPLNVVRSANGADRIPMEVSEGLAYEAVCSWDKRHVYPDGSKQYVLHDVLFPKDEDK